MKEKGRLVVATAYLGGATAYLIGIGGATAIWEVATAYLVSQ